MERYSPKIEIINHFDDLINRIDIEIDSSLNKLNEQKLLSEILKSSENNRSRNRNVHIDIVFFDTIDKPKQKSRFVDKIKESSRLLERNSNENNRRTKKGPKRITQIL